MYDKNGMYIIPTARGVEVSFNMLNYMDGGNGYGVVRGAFGNFFQDPATGAMFAKVYHEPYVINDGSGEVLDNAILGYWETTVVGFWESTSVGSDMWVGSAMTGYVGLPCGEDRSSFEIYF